MTFKVCCKPNFQPLRADHGVITFSQSFDGLPRYINNQSFYTALNCFTTAATKAIVQHVSATITEHPITISFVVLKSNHRSGTC